MLKLVVFDCDGVMFSSKESNRAFYNHILAHFGYPPMDADELEYESTAFGRAWITLRTCNTWKWSRT